MNSRSHPAGKPGNREMCVLALMGALMFALQAALAAVPNIHLTAVLIIVTAGVFGWLALYPVFIFVLLEGLVYGFGLWWVSYLYAWPLLTVAAVLMRKNSSVLIWAVLAALHGLCFGAMCAILYLFTGVHAAFSYWLSGVPFDLAHCAGNFVLTLILYRPLSAALKMASGRK